MTREEFDEILEQTNAVICNRECYERAIKALEILEKIKAVVTKWQTDTWTDNLSHECMCEIADIVAESEDKE